MAEITPSPFISIEQVEPLTRPQICAWNKLLKAHARAGDAIDRATLLLYNIRTTYNFAKQKGIALPKLNPNLEKRLLDVITAFQKSNEAIRLVEDKVYGIRLNNGDIDIMKPNEKSFQGLIIPIIIGIVILAGAIATALWQKDEADKLSKKYNDILESSDDQFCEDRESSLCKAWEEKKLQKKYEKNMTIADTLKSGIVKAGTGLKLGALIGIPIALFFLFRKSK